MKDFLSSLFIYQLLKSSFFWAKISASDRIKLSFFRAGGKTVHVVFKNLSRSLRWNHKEAKSILREN
jgi:hypothetical protein